MSRRPVNVWGITGWDGSEQIFHTTVPCWQITGDQLDALLRALVAKHGLTPREIVGSYLKRGTKGYLAHLEILKHSSDKHKSTDHSCGDSPHFVARVLRPAVRPRKRANVSSNSRSNGRAASGVPAQPPFKMARRSPRR